MRKTLVAALALLMPVPALADIISLPAMGFVHYTPRAGGSPLPEPEPQNGVLSPVVSSLLYQGVDFPVNGRFICSMKLIYGDTNAAESIRARLVRKRITPGADPLAPAAAIAVATSTGAPAGMAVATTTTVTARRIDEVNFFYYVEVIAQNFNTRLVGVQIEHKAACP
ncbi:MAG: hypothetical protein MUC58_05785 [Rhizobiaceae bacterium]|jgi:hypothetical protein|nr:hypothetical protein [Rhizobiaceae bacterium]